MNNVRTVLNNTITKNTYLNNALLQDSTKWTEVILLHRNCDLIIDKAICVSVVL